MKTRSRIIVFVLSFLVWLALTGISDIQEFIAGLIVSAIATIIGGHLLITTRKKNPLLKRIAWGIWYLLRFVWEMLKANIHVAYIVIHPGLPIRPGIVKINTKLTKDAALMMLANSITLTPGTLTVDINPAKSALYIHCIDVKDFDVETSSREIGGRFEPVLREVLE